MAGTVPYEPSSTRILLVAPMRNAFLACRRSGQAAHAFRSPAVGGASDTARGGQACSSSRSPCLRAKKAIERQELATPAVNMDEAAILLPK